MHFVWTDVNHAPEGRDTLHDPKNAITGMLVDLGHTVSKGGFCVGAAPSYTLIFEGFNWDSCGWMNEMMARGARFIIVCTEGMGTGGSLNDSPHQDMFTRKLWLPVAAQQARAVWCLVPGTAAKLRKFCKNAVDIEIGYSAAREKILRDDITEPTAEFCFHGGTMGRRSEVIRQIRATGATVITPRDMVPPDLELIDKDYPPLAIRNRALASSKVSLGISPLNGWKIASSSRFQQALHMGRPVVAEEIDDQESPSPWRKVVPFVKTEDLYLVGKYLADNWRQARDAQLARFKHYLSPAKAIGPAIEALN